ncbi:MAG: glycosyltransferase family 2 protein [Chitinophagaceae bacterium]|nr:MAG: glycosyltransferase family 2 protein [Chitinophagaceae bacterium]
MNFSVVIITKNEGHIIGNTLQSLQGSTDDIVIVDNGSTDDTIAICKTFNARVIETSWKGYGATKNIGIDAAKYDWILSLDADEAIDSELTSALLNLRTPAPNYVYKLSYRNFFCGKEIRYGVWARDKHVRFFNRQMVKWDSAEVHEGLQLPTDVKVASLGGNILHYTVNNIADYCNKTIAYAKSNAKKYYLQGRKAGIIKLYLAPSVNFLQHYIIRLGFLDGWEGFLICKTNAWYTFLKYAFLREMNGKTGR